MVDSNSNSGTVVRFGDTTHTKIFVGGLPWETRRDTMKQYFVQFGEILEAVVITEKITGRSKGYGFVTFKDPESAVRACENPNPVIDGRRANCNLAVLGAQKNHPVVTPPQSQPQRGEVRLGMKKVRESPARPFINPSTSSTSSTSTYFHHYNPQYALIPYYSASYGYQPLHQLDNLTLMNYNNNGYGGGGQGQHYYPNYGGSPGVYYATSYDPFYYYHPIPLQLQRGPTTSNPKLAEPPVLPGKHQQLPPRVGRLMYGQEQVPREITKSE